MNIQIYDLKSTQLDAFMELLPDDVISNKGVNYIGALDEEDYAAGILAYQIINGIVDILFINVYSDLRDEGVETELLNSLLTRVKKSDDLYFITCTYPDNEDYYYVHKALNRSEDFYTKESGRIYYLEPERRTQFKSYDKLIKLKGNVTPFFQISRVDRNMFYRSIKVQGIGFTSQADELSLVDDLSICTRDNSGAINAIILFKNYDDELELSYMMCRKGYEREMALLLAKTLRTLEENYPSELITINTVNEESRNLIENMFGGALDEEVVYTAVRL